MNPIVNETMAIAVRLPKVEWPGGFPDGPQYLSIVQEGAQAPRVLAFDYQAEWELILRITEERAALTVSGVLLVDGRRIEPDAYVRRWRTAIANALTLEQLRKERSMQIVATISWPASTNVRELAPRHASAPFDTFSGLLCMHAGGHRLAAEAARELLHVDLAARNGARDAIWAAWWLREVDGARSSIGVYHAGRTPLVLDAAEGATA